MRESDWSSDVCSSDLRPGGDAGQLTGRVYAINTLGAILGAAGASLVLIPAIGSHHCQQLLAALSAAAALLVFRPRRRIVVAVAALLAALLVWAQPPVPWEVIAYGRDLGIPNSRRGTLLEVSEGMNASVAVTEYDNARLFHVSGKVEASSSEQDMRLQRMLGHIPALVHSGPRSVLVVGCGAGVTAGTFVTHPAVARIVICEIEPRIPPAVARHFRRENHGVVGDPRTRLVFDDARHFVFTTRETFDVITSDPIHPWVKGAATLYTKEYFELCRRRLNPGGIITQWVPLYQSTAEAVRSELATFFEVFPEGVIWGNDTILAEGYDIVLMAQVGGSRIDVDALQERLNRPDHAAAARSLREVGFRTAISLLATYAGRGADLREWLLYAPINLDRNLRLQYLAGMGINIQRATSLYLEILRYRRYPDGLFVTSEASRENLHKALRLP
jgi:spermidine synthase